MMIKKEFFYLLHAKELWMLLFRQILKEELKLNISSILIQSLIEMALDFTFSIHALKDKHQEQQKALKNIFIPFWPRSTLGAIPKWIVAQQHCPKQLLPGL